VKRGLEGCSHKWVEHPETLNYICSMCGAVGARDLAKDPLSQNGILVIRPGKEDLTKMTHHEIRAWYTRHKPLILADIKQLGTKKTRHKWQIPSGTWSKLLLRFGQRPGAAEPAKHKASSDTLPPFPEFSDSWPESVQLGWLEVYRELYRGAR
jgi:hypothetical protein